MTRNSRRPWLLATLATVALLLAACGQPASTAPTLVPATAPVLPTAAPTVAADPTTATTATSAPAASPVASVAAVASPAAASERTGAVERFVLDPAESQARFIAREVLVGRTLPNEAIGVANEMEGAVAIDGDGQVIEDQSRVVVSLVNIRTDQSRRDRFIKGETLQVSRYPNVEFAPREVRGLPNTVPASGEAAFQLVGDLTIHGTTQEDWVWDVEATFGADAVTGIARTVITLPQFGMQKPNVASVLSIEDEIRLEIAFRADRQSAG